MTIADALLLTLGAIAIVSGYLVVSTTHVVRAGLWLVCALGAVAGCFLVMTAEFVAWVQLLIYVGAIVVLLLFATMMTRAPIGARNDLDRRRWPAALLAGAAFLAMSALLVHAFGGKQVDLGDDIGSADEIGALLFSHWVLAFEVLSVLLLAALVGAIAISQQPEPNATEGERR